MVRVIEDAHLQSASGKPLVLESDYASDCAEGMSLDMTVEQRFRNPGNDSLEVVYTFPLHGRRLHSESMCCRARSACTVKLRSGSVHR